MRGSKRPTIAYEEDLQILLIRHGRISGNDSKRYIGQTDESLSEMGRLSLAMRKDFDVYPKPVRLYASPLTRCIETAEILYPTMRPAEIPEWTEISFGEFEGKHWTELSGDPRYQAWIDGGGTGAFPGGESQEEYRIRVMRGLAALADREHRLDRAVKMPDWNGSVEKAPLIAAIVHEGTIMALVSVLTSRPYFEIRVKNGEGYYLRLTAGRAQNGSHYYEVKEALPWAGTESFSIT